MNDPLSLIMLAPLLVWAGYMWLIRRPGARDVHRRRIVVTFRVNTEQINRAMRNLRRAFEQFALTAEQASRNMAVLAQAVRDEQERRRRA